MPKVVVLGSNSFQGQDFIDLLMRDRVDHYTLGFSRSEERKSWDRGAPPSMFVRADLNAHMPEILEDIDRVRPQYVVNFAAQSEVAPSWDHPEDWFQTNCVALARLVNHLRKQTYLKKYLHVSSPEVYGDTSGWNAGHGLNEVVASLMRPSTPYAASKAAADMLLSCYHRQYGFPLVTVRSTNVYGKMQQLWKIIPRTIIAIKQGRKIQLHGGGQAVKSYIHVRDVSRGELAILERGRVGEIYHLSPDRGVKVCDAVELVAKLMGKTLPEVADVAPERPGQDSAYVLSSEKARTELGWSPTIPFRTGVEETIKWVNENWDEIQRQPLEYVHRA